MTRALFILPVLLAGCGAPAPEPAVPAAPMVVVATATPEVEAPALAPPPAAAPPARVLAYHRFAALVPGERAELYEVEKRLLLRAGGRLFSLSATEMHRERDLEKALAREGALDVDTIGGTYPDSLVAARTFGDSGQRVRQYVKIRGPSAIEIARIKEDPKGFAGIGTRGITVLPGGRVLARQLMEAPEQGTLSWLELVPASREPREAELTGIAKARGSQPLVVHRADGSWVVAWAPNPDGATPRIDLRTFGRGAAGSSAFELPKDIWEGPVAAFETTRGALVVATTKAIYAQAGTEWRRTAVDSNIEGACPLPDGEALVVVGAGAFVRAADGVLTPRRWPQVDIQHRRFAAALVDVRYTRDSGFWGIARDGLGVYHDTEPRELVDVASLPPSAAQGDAKQGPR